MSEFTNGHPEFDQLLLLMDRDLPRMGHSAQKHVRECGKCREEIDNCRAAVAGYAFYEEALILPAIPPAPHPWLNLRIAIGPTAAVRPRLTDRLANSFGRLLVAAVAFAMLAFAVVLMTRSERRPSENIPPPPPSHPSAPLAAPGVPDLASRKAESGRPRLPVDAGPPAMESPMNTEVRVFAALHRLGADLGEPVEVGTQPDGKILVGGKGLAPERQAEIRQAVAAEPGVVIRFDKPADAGRGISRESTRIDAVPTRLQVRLRTFLGSQAAYEGMSNRVLDESDAVLARAHALQNLAGRFPSARRPELGEAERRSLDAMTAAHRAAFHEHARTLLRLIEPLSKALSAPAPTAAQPASALESAQRLDRVLSAIFGAGTDGRSPDELLAEFSNASATFSATVAPRQ